MQRSSSPNDYADRSAHSTSTIGSGLSHRATYANTWEDTDRCHS
jgi:hypothetical protein